jgi:hypothetical protein
MITKPNIDQPEPIGPPELEELKPFLKPYPWLDPDKLSAGVIKRFLCMVGHKVRPVARIELRVTEFHTFANASDPAHGICVIDPPNVTVNPIAPGNPNPTNPPRGRVTQIAGDEFTLRISRGSAGGNPRVPLILEFVITSGVQGRQYAPVGIFIADSGLEKSFSVASVQGNVIRVLNHYVEAPKFWQFMIGIRDTTSNQMGMIDPGMEDNDEPF